MNPRVREVRSGFRGGDGQFIPEPDKRHGDVFKIRSRRKGRLRRDRPPSHGADPMANDDVTGGSGSGRDTSGGGG